jgi:phospholipid/cholesterol/gamma-HCH transport system ATP-binding protein
MKKSEWDRYRSQISYMFQDNALFDSLSVFENIALPLRQTTDLRKKQIEQKVMARIDQMELTDVVHKYPSELSGGMQKRVALARSLVTDPAIVLFDEPTTGQDPIRKNVILSMIAHYRKQFGFTAVLISHDIPDVFFISDRILLLWEGKIAFHGTYEELAGLKHPLIDEFLRSMQGLRDELTGLLTKEMFRARYAMSLGRESADAESTAVLFGIRADILADALGTQASIEVLKALGEHLKSYFGRLGGFSVRHRRDEFLTIFPNISLEKTERLMDDFAVEFQQKALPDVRALAAKKTGFDACFEIYLIAGMTACGALDDIEQLLVKAEENQKVIARYPCGKEGGLR